MLYAARRETLTHLHDITEPVCLFPWAKGQPMGRAALRRALLRIALESSVLYTLLFALGHVRLIGPGLRH
jgi:hypothetical protein